MEKCSILAKSTDLTQFQSNFFFELKDKSSDEIQSKTIIIRLLYTSGILRNDMIGQYEETLTSIYLNKEHVLEH